MTDPDTTAPTAPTAPTAAPHDDPGSGRHPVNVGHLVMGIAFAGLALVWSLVQYDVVAGRDIRWLLPVPWVLAGGAGLVASATAGARRHRTRTTGGADQPGWTDPRSHQEQP